eukprot:1045904-Pelagomonas_calceolata.AAC.1
MDALLKVSGGSKLLAGGHSDADNAFGWAIWPVSVEDWGAMVEQAAAASGIVAFRPATCLMTCSNHNNHMFQIHPPRIENGLISDLGPRPPPLPTGLLRRLREAMCARIEVHGRDQVSLCSCLQGGYGGASNYIAQWIAYVARKERTQILKRVEDAFERAEEGGGGAAAGQAAGQTGPASQEGFLELLRPEEQEKTRIFFLRLQQYVWEGIDEAVSKRQQQQPQPR